MSDLVTLEDLRAAQRVLAGQVHRTPMTTSTYLGERAGVRLSLKLELFQKTGSFKPRGVLNRLHHLPAEARAKGVISLSAGNHAQALAWAAARAGIAATLVMPATARQSKIDATRGYGAEVILTEGDLLGTCLALRDERDLTLVHPFDDPFVIAGQGTTGMELLEDVPDVEVVLVSVGGGGLISGVAAALKLQRPGIRVIGVEPEGAAAMTRSLARGEPVHLDRLDTIADGLAAPFVGVHTLRHVQAFIDEVVLVSDAEIIAAMGLIMERVKVVAEPAAAAAVAALLAGRPALPPGARVATIVCGGNVDRADLKRFL